MNSASLININTFLVSQDILTQKQIVCTDIQIDTNNKLQNNLLKKYHFNPLSIPLTAIENLAKSEQTSSFLLKWLSKLYVIQSTTNITTFRTYDNTTTIVRNNDMMIADNN